MAWKNSTHAGLESTIKDMPTCIKIFLHFGDNEDDIYVSEKVDSNATCYQQTHMMTAT